MRILDGDAAAALPSAMLESAHRDLPELKRLYESHAEYIRGLLARLLGPGGEADDLTHETFLVAWRRPQVLASADDERAWLSGIALKKAQALRRRRRLRRFLGVEAAERIPDLRTPATALEQEDASRIVYLALDRLAEKKRTVFVLFELQGMTGSEIAQLLRCPLQTVKTRLFYARREFASAIASWKADEDARHGN
jgi:RNA polymerase sigma-70 factor (ECF subfamily)